MVQIVESRVIAESKPPKWSDERTFESADGPWKLQFHNPNEWHMGADGWQLKLTYNDQDVSAGHQLFKTIGTGKGFHLPNTSPGVTINLLSHFIRGILQSIYTTWTTVDPYSVSYRVSHLRYSGRRVEKYLP